jgi:hypothetical protein
VKYQTLLCSDVFGLYYKPRPRTKVDNKKPVSGLGYGFSLAIRTTAA